MATVIIDQWINQIEEIVSQATKPPWIDGDYGKIHAHGFKIASFDWMAGPKTDKLVKRIKRSKHNQTFTATARSAMPRLLKLVKIFLKDHKDGCLFKEDGATDKWSKPCAERCKDKPDEWCFYCADVAPIIAEIENELTEQEELV